MTEMDGCVVNGRKWFPFAVDFESPDGKFTFTIYALSEMHAHLQVEAIRETAKVYGQIADTLPC